MSEAWTGVELGWEVKGLDTPEESDDDDGTTEASPEGVDFAELGDTLSDDPPEGIEGGCSLQIMSAHVLENMIISKIERTVQALARALYPEGRYCRYPVKELGIQSML